MKRPKGKLTAFWIITSLLGLTGCLMAVISIGVPWRVGEPMSIFTSYKYYTIFGAQGQGSECMTQSPAGCMFGKRECACVISGVRYMSWSLVAQQTCDRSKLLGMGSGITQMTCAATGPMNEQCNLAFQKHVRDRCTGYRFFGSLSMAVSAVRDGGREGGRDGGVRRPPSLTVDGWGFWCVSGCGVDRHPGGVWAVRLHVHLHGRIRLAHVGRGKYWTGLDWLLTD